jgi:hypothetical protein
LTIDYFESFFSVNSYKAMINFSRYLDKKSKKDIIIKSFPKLLKLHNGRAIKLLEETEDRILIDNMISKYFKKIFFKDKKVAIRLLKGMKNSEQRDKVIAESLELFQYKSSQLRSVINLLSTKKLKDIRTIQACKELVDKDLNGLIELLNQLTKGELKEKIILDSTEQLAKKGNLTKIITLVNKTASNELRTKIKERYRHLANKSIEEYKKRLYNLENIQIEQKRESIIEEAHTIVDIQKSQEKELDLESATVEILSSLVINVENQERQRELLSLMITKMKSDKNIPL